MYFTFIYLNIFKEENKMALANQNNKKSENNDSYNTRGFQFFNKNGLEGSTLILGMWNQMVTLTMHPAKEQGKQTDTSVFDYDKSIRLVIPPQFAFSIYNCCMDKLIPALEKGEEYTIGFAIGANSVLVLSTGVKKYNKVVPHVIIMRNINPNNMIPEEGLSYTFNPNLVIPDFHVGNEGGPLNVTNYYGELYYFIKAFGHISTALLGAENHTRRYFEKKYNDQVFALYKDISNKIGGSFYSSPNNNGGGYASNNIWNNNQNQYRQQQESNTNTGVKPSEVDDINELDDLF